MARLALALGVELTSYAYSDYDSDFISLSISLEDIECVKHFISYKLKHHYIYGVDLFVI